MKHSPYPGGWYVDATPSGKRAILYPLKRLVGTLEGPLPFLPDNDYPLFIVVTEVGGFKVAGKAHESTKTWEYEDGQWKALPEAIGNYSVIYDLNGVLHISEGGAVGSQGWRYVDPNNIPITGDATYGSNFGLHEWTDLSQAQDRSLVVGQGSTRGGVEVKDGDVLRRLASGACYAIRAKRQGVNVSIAWYEVESDGLTAHVVLATVAELQALPLAEEPVMTDRFWYFPNIASQDMVTMFDEPANLKSIDAFQLFIQNIIFDNPNQGPNTRQALQANHVYKKLKQEGVLTVIEMGSVKGGDCQCVNAIHNLEWAVNLVRAEGGNVDYIAMDEPLTADKEFCHQGLDKTADAVAVFIRKATSLSVQVGLIEAWPNVDFATQKLFLDKLKARGVPLAFLHADIDWNRAASSGQNTAAFIRDMQQLADIHDITLGIYLNSTVDPIATEVAHHANILALAQKVKGIIPNADRLIVGSWAFRAAGGLQNVPNNLGPNGLLETYADVRALFAGEEPEEPVEPEPEPQEGHQMFSTFTDPLKEVIAVKRVKLIEGTSVGPLHTLILPNDRVYSCQPDGSSQDRDPGTEGAWERCHVDGNVATFKPGDKYFSKSFVIVEGL